MEPRVAFELERRQRENERSETPREEHTHTSEIAYRLSGYVECAFV